MKPVAGLQPLQRRDVTGRVVQFPATVPQPSLRQPSPSQRKGLALVWAKDMKARLFAGGTLVKGFLDAGAMSVVYAPSNVGKSFFCLDLALHVAMGFEWRGRKIKMPGCVVYFATEGGAGFVNRVVSLKLHHGIGDDDACPLAVVAAPVDLLDPKAHLQEINDLIAEASVATGMPVVLVVIDTLSRAMAGGDENNPKDMTTFVANVDAIRHANTAPHCMIVHHAGKDVARGARGHSSLRAATDTEIEITKTTDGIDKNATASVRKQRDLAGEDEFPFTLASVHLGQDDDGDPVTSAVVVHITEPKATPKPGGVAGMKLLYLDKLRDCLLLKGTSLTVPEHVPPNTEVVKQSEWRKSLEDGGLIDGDTPGARRMKFDRIRKEMLKSREIGIWTDFAWIVRDD